MRKLYSLLPTGSVILSITTFGSYGAGLLRDRILAQSFGAGRELDSYMAAFLLPDFLFNFFIASGIAAAVVPIVTDLLKKDTQEMRRYVSSVMGGAIMVMGVVSLFLIFFADALSTIIVPGFTSEDQAQVAGLLRILAFSPLFFSVSNALGAFLIVKRRYLFYGLSPIFYNIGIILGALFLSSRFGITGVAYGTVFGAFLHMLLRVIDAKQSGFRLHKNISFRTQEFSHTLRLMIPKMFGHPVELATFWGFTIFASTLAPGSVTVINFARNFQSVPVSLIGITLATTTFPLLASALTNKNVADFIATLKRSFWLILGGSVLAALFIFLVREPLVALVFGGGAFSQTDVQDTALVLGFFTLAIPPESLSHLLARGFYATKNTLVPVLIGVANFIIAISLAGLLTPKIGIIAVPLAFFGGSIFKLLFLSLLLPSHIRKMGKQKSFTP